MQTVVWDTRGAPAASFERSFIVVQITMRSIGGNAGVGQSPRRAPGRVERRGDQSVDVRLDLLDPRDVRIDDLQRARVSDADSSRQLRGSESDDSRPSQVPRVLPALHQIMGRLREGGEILHGVDQMGEVAAEAVELPDHKHVALPQRPQAAVESRPVVADAGRGVVIEVDRVVDASGPQGVAPQVQATGSRRSSRRGRSRSACVANDRLRHMRAPDPAGAALEFRPGGVAASQSPAPFVSGCSTRTSSPVPRRRLPRPWPACRGSRTVRRQPVREAWSTGNSLESRLGATPRQAATARRAACRRGSPPSRLVPSAVEEAVTKTSTGPPAAAGCTVRRCPHPARCPRTTARADRQGLSDGSHGALPQAALN